MTQDSNKSLYSRLVYKSPVLFFSVDLLYGTIQPILCWCAVMKLLTHSLHKLLSQLCKFCKSYNANAIC